ncbi:MAG TPA: TlpA disulfide reductase family protein [Ilumatobacter sp.]|nr:TlpA disulfide reductase family protein [Ilumatobacter sp.]
MSGSRFSTRHLVGAGVAAMVASVAVVGVGLWATGDDSGESFDGTIQLDEPGIYDEPLDEVNPDPTGLVLPDVPLEDAEGNSVDLASYRGKPLVLNFWFSRCAPCARELADFQTVYEEVGDTVQFVGIDPFDTVEEMVSFADERGVTYDRLRDPERSFVNVVGLVAYPVTMFVDAEGRILRQTGELNDEELRAAIDELF